MSDDLRAARDEGAIEALEAIRGQFQLRNKNDDKRFSELAEPTEAQQLQYKSYREAFWGGMHTVNEAIYGIKMRNRREAKNV